MDTRKVIHLLFFVMLFPTVGLLAQGRTDKVVARIDGKDWTSGDVKALLATVPVQVRNAYAQDPIETINHILTQKYLAEQARLSRLADDPQVKKNCEWARINFLAQAELSYVREGYRPSGDEVKALYDKNINRWEQARVRAIYLSVPFVRPGTVLPGRTEEQAIAKAEEIRTQLAGGADFAVLARANSEDKPSAEKGGEWPGISRLSPYPEDVKTAIFALKPGEVTRPIRQPNGVFLFQLESIEKQPLAEVQSSISAALGQARFDEWFAKMKQRFAPKIKDPVYFGQDAADGGGKRDADDDDDDAPRTNSDRQRLTPAKKVVIEIDGKNWTAGELRTRLAMLPAHLAEAFSEDAVALGNSFLLRYLAAQAEIHHLDQDSEVRHNVEWSEVNFLSESELTYARTSYRPSHDEEKRHYEQTLGRWQEANVWAIFIAFSSSPGVSDRTEEQAKTIAEGLRNKLEKGADFTKLAKANSDDQASARRGGKWSSFTPGGAQPQEIKAVVFALKPGSVSEPVRQSEGFYLFKLEALRTQPFVAVEPKIVQEVQQTHFNEWYASLKSRFSAQVEDAGALALVQP